MENLNMVRRVDKSGKIRIPMDIRKLLNIEEGAFIEFYLDNKNNIILKKYKNK